MPVPRPEPAPRPTRPPVDPYAPRHYRSRSYRGPAFPTPAPRAHRSLIRRWGQALIVFMALIGLLASCGAVGSFLWVRGVDDNIKREDPFAGLTDRPPKLVSSTLNILLLGTDSRDPEYSGETQGARRTDTILLLHIPAAHDRAYLISIPRDLWVHVPRSSDGRSGNTMAKINAAYAWGGMPLAVQTVEEYTGVRVDHVASVDFAGFVKVTDAVGGVDMTVDQTITSIHPPYRTFTAGPHHFTGEEALDYVRQRYQFSDGDFARMRHQQEFLKALVDQVASMGTLTNIPALRDLISSVADTMTVDQSFSLMDVAWQFRNLDGDHLVFLVSPNLGGATVGGQSVVNSDRAGARDLYDAVNHDRLGDWVSVHGTGG